MSECIAAGVARRRTPAATLWREVDTDDGPAAAKEQTASARVQ